MTPRPMSPEAFDKLIRDDVATFARIARCEHQGRLSRVESHS